MTWHEQVCPACTKEGEQSKTIYSKDEPITKCMCGYKFNEENETTMQYELKVTGTKEEILSLLGDSVLGEKLGDQIVESTENTQDTGVMMACTNIDAQLNAEMGQAAAQAQSIPMDSDIYDYLLKFPTINKDTVFNDPQDRKAIIAALTATGTEFNNRCKTHTLATEYIQYREGRHPSQVAAGMDHGIQQNLTPSANNSGAPVGHGNAPAGQPAPGNTQVNAGATQPATQNINPAPAEIADEQILQAMKDASVRLSGVNPTPEMKQAANGKIRALLQSYNAPKGSAIPQPQRAQFISQLNALV